MNLIDHITPNHDIANLIDNITPNHDIANLSDCCKMCCVQNHLYFSRVQEYKTPPVLQRTEQVQHWVEVHKQTESLP